jgi:hypothetical protein
VLHSDIKSKNVLLNGAMHAKISDVRMLPSRLHLKSMPMVLLWQPWESGDLNFTGDRRQMYKKCVKEQCKSF